MALCSFPRTTCHPHTLLQTKCLFNAEFKTIHHDLSKLPFIRGRKPVIKNIDHLEHRLRISPVFSSSIDVDFPDGLPQEIVEDGKFVPINDSDAGFGPPVLFFAGFDLDEITKIRSMLEEMNGDFLRIVLCTEGMKNNSLISAIETIQTFEIGKEDLAKNVPRICFLSGLNGEEIMIFIDSINEIGLDPTIFAALMPKNADKSMNELFEEIQGDHDRLTKSNQD